MAKADKIEYLRYYEFENYTIYQITLLPLKYHLLFSKSLINDTIFKVPEGVSIRVDERESQKFLANLDKIGDEVIVAVGGTGGGSNNNWIGQRGQSLHVRLDLRVSY